MENEVFHHWIWGEKSYPTFRINPMAKLWRTSWRISRDGFLDSNRRLRTRVTGYDWIISIFWSLRIIHTMEISTNGFQPEISIKVFASFVDFISRRKIHCRISILPQPCQTWECQASNPGYLQPPKKRLKLNLGTI